ncbi:MAG: hypothetical protein IPJ82_05960 [Lewinellaceae bacterium]|nr:hypothetical protein [Lewinellaceae bacterium]
MPFHDVVQQHIQTEELAALDKALDALEKAVENQKRNLTPDERKKYGSINEANKLFVNKVYDYCKAQPALCSPDVNWDEFAADYQDRAYLETRLNRMRSIMESLENSKILHDYDNFQNSLVDYSYTQYKKDTDAGGYMTKYNELKQFFPRTGTNGNGSTTPSPEPE